MASSGIRGDEAGGLRAKLWSRGAPMLVSWACLCGFGVGARAWAQESAPPPADQEVDAVSARPRVKSPVDEFSVLGTINGGDNARWRDAALLLDVVTGKTLALVKGQCLPRWRDLCIDAVGDGTVEVAGGGRTLALARIDGAEPKGGDDYGASQELAQQTAAVDEGGGTLPGERRLPTGPDGRWSQRAPSQEPAGGGAAEADGDVAGADAGGVAAATPWYSQGDGYSGYVTPPTDPESAPLQADESFAAPGNRDPLGVVQRFAPPPHSWPRASGTASSASGDE
jgi:hypothetical protein